MVLWLYIISPVDDDDYIYMIQYIFAFSKEVVFISVYLFVYSFVCLSISSIMQIIMDIFSCNLVEASSYGQTH